MAKSRPNSDSRSKPAANRAQKPGASAIRAASVLTARDTEVPEGGNELNGDNGNGNGKVRYKSLIINGTKYRTHLNHKFENRKSWESPDPRKITSSIPGTVIKLYVSEGQEVKQGDQMLTLEAMKMKNRIMFHAGGTVKTIYVREGERIPKDFLMLEMK